MPLGLSPNDFIDVSLDSIDAGKPESDRAKFRLRFITAGEMKKVERLRRAAWAARNPLDADRIINEAVRIGIIGWSGLKNAAGSTIEFAPAPPEIPPAPKRDKDGKVIPGEFEPSDPPYDVLDEFSLRQKMDMVAEYPFELLINDKEKKASPLPSPGDTAGSAKAAPAESARTNQV